MAITNYVELVQAIQDYMFDRSDLVDFAPDFITQAEQVINYGSEDIDPIRIRDMETLVSLTPTAHVYALPDGYLQYRNVTEESSPRRPLDYIDPKGVDQLYPLRMSGFSNHFTIIGDSLYTYPLSTNDVEMVYYAAVPALTSDDDTNWLLTKAPGVYLRLSLMFAAEFIKAPSAEIGKQAQMAKSLIGGLNRSNMMANYARAGLTLRGMTP
jgi:hypothetical protein